MKKLGFDTESEEDDGIETVLLPGEMRSPRSSSPGIDLTLTLTLTLGQVALVLTCANLSVPE